MTASLTPAEEKFFETQGEVAPEPAQPETKPESTPAPKAEEKKEESVRMFPEAAYRREQDERRKAQKEMQALREELARMKGMQEASQPKKEEPQVPEFDKDPATHLKLVQDDVKQKLAKLEQTEAQREEERKRTEAQQRFVSAYQEKVEEFRVKAPDFNEAYRHVMMKRDAQLQRMGIDNPLERKQTIEAEEQFLVARAMNAGLNPAEKLYEMAQDMGYARKEQKTVVEQAKEEAPRNEKGQFTSAEEKLQTIEKGQQASKSLGGTSGSAGDTGLSIASLLKLPKEDQEAIILDEKRFRRLAGAE